MSSPNSLALRSTHSRRGSRGGHPGGGLGHSLSSSVGTHHSPRLSKHSAGVASAATTRQGRGAGAVSPMAMAYSTPAQSLTFSKVLATSQGHLVSSLSQSQSTSAARRKGDARPLAGNVATKKRQNYKTKRLIQLRTITFLKTSSIRCHSFKISCTDSRKSFVT